MMHAVSPPLFYLWLIASLLPSVSFVSGWLLLLILEGLCRESLEPGSCGQLPNWTAGIWWRTPVNPALFPYFATTGRNQILLWLMEPRINFSCVNMWWQGQPALGSVSTSLPQLCFLFWKAATVTSFYQESLPKGLHTFRKAETT